MISPIFMNSYLLEIFVSGKGYYSAYEHKNINLKETRKTCFSIHNLRYNSPTKGPIAPHRGEKITHSPETFSTVYRYEQKKPPRVDIQQIQYTVSSDSRVSWYGDGADFKVDVGGGNLHALYRFGRFWYDSWLIRHRLFRQAGSNQLPRRDILIGRGPFQRAVSCPLQPDRVRVLMRDVVLSKPL